jgi:TPR repeat protein
MYRLGLAEIHGSLGMPRNVRDGNKWLKRSAEAATTQYPHALHELGLLHEKGLDGIIFKDLSYSVQLYAHAAELGYAPSASRLGEAYEFGYLNCNRDAAASIYYYTIAASQGIPEACFALSAWYISGEKEVFEPSEEKAYYWANMAAKMGYAKGQFALGYFIESGLGCSKDESTAMGWYKKAAEQGDQQAIQRLQTGKHVRPKKNSQKSRPPVPTTTLST